MPRWTRSTDTSPPVACADPAHVHCASCVCPLVVLAGDGHRRHCVRCYELGRVERLPRVDELALGVGAWSWADE